MGRIRVGLVGAALLFWLAGGLPATAELKLALAEYPASIHPVYATSETGQAVLNKLYHALFAVDGRGVLQPELAEDWRYDPATRTVHLRLRAGFAFPSGQAVTAADVAATYALLANPAFAFPYRSDLDFIAAMRAEGERALAIELRRPLAPWRIYLTFKVLAAGELKWADPATFARIQPAGSGPYRLVRAEPPLALHLERNPAWHGPLPSERLVYVVELDPRNVPRKLLSGEIQAGEIQPEDAELYGLSPARAQRFRLVPYEKYGFTYLVFNTRRPALSLPFRQAVQNRLVAGTFLARFLRGRGRPVTTPVLALESECAPPLQSPPPRFASPGRVRLLTNGESRIRRHFVLFAAEELKRDGIEVEPQFLEYHAFIKALRAGEFDMAVSAFLLDPDYNVRDILAGDGVCNYSGFVDPGLDSLLQDGLVEMDEHRRRDVYRAVHRRWAEELPLLPLFSLYYHMGLTQKLRPPAGPPPVVGSTGDFFYRIGEWRFDAP